MSLWSWAFVLFLVIGVPIQSLRSAAVVARIPRTAVYLNVTLTLWILAVLGWSVLRLDGQRLADVGMAAFPAGAGIGWAVGVTVIGMGLFVISRLAARRALWPEGSASLARLRPRTRAEWLIVCLLVAPTAGICEEFLFRGLLLTRLADLTGSLLVAVILTSAAFGLSHLYQGWAGATLAALVGAALAWPVIAVGSLIPSMAAHALIDILALRVWQALETPRPRGIPAP